MSVKSGIYRLILISVMAISILSCAFKGDGEYKKSTNWLLFYPVHDYTIKFKKFSLESNPVSYTFENVCSSNKSFTLYLSVEAEKGIQWSNNAGIVNVTLSNEKEGTVFKSAFQFNNKEQRVWREDYGVPMQSYFDLEKNLPEKHILLALSSSHKLGCEKYTLNLLPQLPHSLKGMSAQLGLLSAWK